MKILYALLLVLVSLSRLPSYPYAFCLPSALPHARLTPATRCSCLFDAKRETRLMMVDDGKQLPEDGADQAPEEEDPEPPFQIPFLVSLSISLVQRVLRMGDQVRRINIILSWVAYMFLILLSFFFFFFQPGVAYSCLVFCLRCLCFRARWFSLEGGIFLISLFASVVLLFLSAVAYSCFVFYLRCLCFCPRWFIPELLFFFFIGACLG